MSEISGACPHSCVDCGVLNCGRQDKTYPDFCLTTGLTEEEIAELAELYADPVNRRISIASAEVEGAFYGQMTRVEETMEFAKRIGAKKIGIATCVGLIEESRILTKILRLRGFEVYGAACKVGAMKKTGVGVDEAYTCKTGGIMCNPIAQAKLLAKEGVDLNIMMGLCCGHDSLFLKYAEDPVTVLVVKDRVLGNNPVQALYQARAYYRRLLAGEEEAAAGEENDRRADILIAAAELTREVREAREAEEAAAWYARKAAEKKAAEKAAAKAAEKTAAEKTDKAPAEKKKPAPKAKKEQAGE